MKIASHSVPGSRSYAIWLLLQLLRRRVPLCSRHRLARVSLSDHWQFQTLVSNYLQCPNHNWRSMHDSLAHSYLAKLC